MNLSQAKLGPAGPSGRRYQDPANGKLTGRRSGVPYRPLRQQSLHFDIAESYAWLTVHQLIWPGVEPVPAVIDSKPRSQRVLCDVSMNLRAAGQCEKGRAIGVLIACRPDDALAQPTWQCVARLFESECTDPIGAQRDAHIRIRLPGRARKSPRTQIAGLPVRSRQHSGRTHTNRSAATRCRNRQTGPANR